MQSPTDPNVRVGSRLSYNGDLCTVRFIGKIPPWSVLAYGVEWDDPSRGKNNGSLQQIQYFNCLDNPNSGSFIKSTKKYDEICSFTQAVVNRYTLQEGYLAEKDKGDISSLLQVSASKLIETYGSQKMKAKQENLSALDTVTLDKHCIGDETEPLDDSPLIKQLVSLNHLNLAFNLISSVTSVVNICHGITSLRGIVLNGNRFPTPSDPKELETRCCPQVDVLSLSNTRVKPNEFEAFAAAFPNVSTVSLAYNHLSSHDESEISFSCFSKVIDLDLSYNEFKFVPGASILPIGLKKLTLAYNKLSSQSMMNSCHTLEYLDLSHNEISQFEFLDNISNSYPNVVNLRLNGNPLEIPKELLENNSNEENMNDIRFLLTLGRWSGNNSLEKLNGITVDERDITEAELYFISLVTKGIIKYNKESKHWKKLATKYNKSATIEAKDNKPQGISQRFITVTVTCKSLGVTKNGKFLKTDPVQKVKGIIIRMFKAQLRSPIVKIKLWFYDEKLQKEVELDDNFSLLQSYGLEQGSVLYFEKI